MASARLVIKDGTGAITFDSTQMVTPLVLDEWDTGTSAGSRTLPPIAGGNVVLAQIPANSNSSPGVATVSGGTVSWTAGGQSSRIRALVF